MGNSAKMRRQTHGDHVVRPCHWLPLLCAAYACKPQRETIQRQAQLTTAPTAALTDAAFQASASDDRDIIAQIAKLIVGLNPDVGDRHDHIGLANVAAIMGYDLPLNDCGTPWQIASDGPGSIFTLTLSSQHDRGVGPNCHESDLDAPVAYLFQDWSATAQITSWLSFAASATPADAPNPSGQGNGAGLKDLAAGIDAQGRRQWTSQESVEATSSGRPEGELLSLKYTRTVPRLPVLQAVGHRRTGYGLSAAPKAAATEEPSYTFSAGWIEKPTPAWVQAQCLADVAVPPGCRYKTTITAQFLQSQRRFRAELQVTPKSIGLRGRLGSQSPCNQLHLRKVDGTCGGSMGRERKGVEAWFGRTAVGFNFAQDLAAQASARQSDSGGDWDFAAMRLQPGQQSQGIPNIDWALRYFQLATYANASAQFDQFEERVASCHSHTDILPGSAPSCTAVPQDRDIQPTLQEVLP